MRLKCFYLLVAALLLVPLAASACMSTPAEKHADFDARDGDKDGFLTLEEYYGDSDATNAVPFERKKEYITSLDKDADGKLDFEEFSAYSQKRY